VAASRHFIETGLMSGRSALSVARYMTLPGFPRSFPADVRYISLIPVCSVDKNSGEARKPLRP
jgi:hypothetical protein